MTDRWLRSIITCSAMAWLTGCAGTTSRLERYRLTPVSAPQASAQSPTADPNAPTLAVEPYATMGIYADPQIVYRLGETTYGAYPDREWAIPLGTMLADATLETMRGMPQLDVRVTDDRVAGAHRLVWRGVVQQFEEVNRGDKLAAAVRLDAAVVRTPGDSIVWQGTAGLERPVDEPTMHAIVHTLSDLSSTAIRQLVNQARTALNQDRIASVNE